MSTFILVQVTSILEQVHTFCTSPAELFFKKKPCKKLADPHSKQGNLLHRNTFTGLCETFLHCTKYVGWRSSEKIRLLPTRFLKCYYVCKLPTTTSMLFRRNSMNHGHLGVVRTWAASVRLLSFSQSWMRWLKPKFSAF
jgi:hypothetical protein